MFDPELVLMYAVLLAVLAIGCTAIYYTYHWYRNQKDTPSSSREELVQFAESLHDEDLSPEEQAKIRAAVEKQQRKENEK